MKIKISRFSCGHEILNSHLLDLQYRSVGLSVDLPWVNSGITVTPLRLASPLKTKSTQLMIQPVGLVFFGINFGRKCCRGNYNKQNTLWWFDYFERINYHQPE